MTDVQKQKDDKPKDGKDSRGVADGSKKEESKEPVLPEEELVSSPHMDVNSTISKLCFV